MPRPSRTGVRGLHLIGRRYKLDIRHTDPRTGQPKRFREWLPAGTKAEAARAYAQATRERLLSGRVISGQPLSYYLGRYLGWSRMNNRSSTFRWKKNVATVLGQRWGHLAPEDLTQANVHRWRSELAASRKPATVNRYLTTLRHFYRWMAEHKFVSWESVREVSSVKLLREPGERKRWLEPDEERRLFRVAGPPLKQAIVIARDCGLDQGEIVRLDWNRHVRLDRGVLDVRREKTGVERVVPLTQAARDAFVSLCPDEAHRRGRVFRTWDGRPLTQWGLVSQWKRARDRAGIQDFRFKDLRHDFGTRLYDAGVPLEVIRDLLGHSEKSGLRTVLRYAHRKPRVYAEAIQKLDPKRRDPDPDPSPA